MHPPLFQEKLEFKEEKRISLLESELTNTFEFRILLEQRFAGKSYDAIQKRRRKEAKDAYEKGNRR